jgi:hypothetical protein
VHGLQRSGRRKDISLETLIEIARDAERTLGRPLPGVIHRTGAIGEPARELQP